MYLQTQFLLCLLCCKLQDTTIEKIRLLTMSSEALFLAKARDVIEPIRIRQVFRRLRGMRPSFHGRCCVIQLHHFQQFRNIDIFGGRIQISSWKMADFTRLDNPELSKMCLQKHRLASFHNWPFQDEGQEHICTAQKANFSLKACFYFKPYCKTDLCMISDGRSWLLLMCDGNFTRFRTMLRLFQRTWGLGTSWWSMVLHLILHLRSLLEYD